MEEILRLENISFNYEGKYVGLKNISASICRGERIAVLGSNGAGKSTFFLCCNGVLTPQEGKIILRGQEIAGKKAVNRLRQTVGVVFQDPDSQIIAGTVADELSFGPINLGLAPDEVKLRIKQALEQMNLTGYDSRAPQYLSGGEKKRVSIADIIAMQPEIILLDEPTASLDPANVAVLENTLDELSGQGITLVVSTHDVDFACRFAERGIVFCDGEIIADGDIETVFSSDETLCRAGLEKPLLYQATEAICERLSLSCALAGPMPKSVGQFEEFIRDLKIDGGINSSR